MCDKMVLQLNLIKRIVDSTNEAMVLTKSGKMQSYTNM